MHKRFPKKNLKIIQLSKDDKQSYGDDPEEGNGNSGQYLHGSTGFERFDPSLLNMSFGNPESTTKCGRNPILPQERGHPFIEQRSGLEEYGHPMSYDCYEGSGEDFEGSALFRDGFPGTFPSVFPGQSPMEDSHLLQVKSFKKLGPIGQTYGRDDQQEKRTSSQDKSRPKKGKSTLEGKGGGFVAESPMWRNVPAKVEEYDPQLFMSLNKFRKHKGNTLKTSDLMQKESCTQEEDENKSEWQDIDEESLDSHTSNISLSEKSSVENETSYCKNTKSIIKIIQENKRYGLRDELNHEEDYITDKNITKLSYREENSLERETRMGEEEDTNDASKGMRLNKLCKISKCNTKIKVLKSTEINAYLNVSDEEMSDNTNKESDHNEKNKTCRKSSSTSVKRNISQETKKNPLGDIKINRYKQMEEHLEQEHLRKKESLLDRHSKELEEMQEKHQELFEAEKERLNEEYELRLKEEIIYKELQFQNNIDRLKNDINAKTDDATLAMFGEETIKLSKELDLEKMGKEILEKKYKSEIARLTNDLDEIKSRENGILAEKSKQVEDLHYKVMEEQHFNVGFQKQINVLKEQNNILKEENGKNKELIKEMEDQTNDFKDQVEREREEKNNLEEEIRNLKSAIIDLETKGKCYLELTKNLDTFKEENEMMKMEIKNSTIEIQSLNANLAEKQKHLERLSEINNDINKKVEDKKRTLEMLKLDNNRLKENILKENNELKEMLEKKEKHIQELTANKTTVINNELQEKDKQINNLKCLEINYKAKNSRISKELTNKCQQCSSLKEEINNLKNEMKNKDNELTENKITVNDYRRTIKTLKRNSNNQDIIIGYTDVKSDHSNTGIEGEMNREHSKTVENLGASEKDHKPKQSLDTSLETNTGTEMENNFKNSSVEPTASSHNEAETLKEREQFILRNAMKLNELEMKVNRLRKEELVLGEELKDLKQRILKERRALYSGNQGGKNDLENPLSCIKADHCSKVEDRKVNNSSKCNAPCTRSIRKRLIKESDLILTYLQPANSSQEVFPMTRSPRKPRSQKSPTTIDRKDDPQNPLKSWSSPPSGMDVSQDSYFIEGQAPNLETREKIKNDLKTKLDQVKTLLGSTTERMNKVGNEFFPSETDHLPFNE